MQVFSNGELLRTIPITTGKAGFTTRSGTKVIMEKFAVKRMNSETVGIASSDPEAYDIDDVQWAMRLTDSGEFIHAAPWSVGLAGLRQRLARLHGHVDGRTPPGSTTSPSAATSSSTPAPTGAMTLDNGYGDWNADFATYKAGSALS